MSKKSRAARRRRQAARVAARSAAWPPREGLTGITHRSSPGLIEFSETMRDHWASLAADRLLGGEPTPAPFYCACRDQPLPEGETEAVGEILASKRLKQVHDRGRAAERRALRDELERLLGERREEDDVRELRRRLRTLADQLAEPGKVPQPPGRGRTGAGGQEVRREPDPARPAQEPRR